MDSGAIAAWVAFTVALIALLIALAQVAQQYLATAQSMRKCDKSVWGPMPGHSGRRIWIWHQLRFRIVFDIPNIFIPTEYWDVPGSARLFPAKRVASLPSHFDELRFDTDPEANVQQSSEACWVSFARQLSHICPAAVRVGLMTGDVDRLPSDLPVVPMQVSIRDIIALGLMIGMTITSADRDDLEMSGPSGFIKSSSHPLLGRLIHFSAFSKAPRSFHKGLRSGDISKSWLHRLKGIAGVANKPYSEQKRQYYEQIGRRWRDNQTRFLQYAAPEEAPPQEPNHEALKEVHLVFATGDDGKDTRLVHIDKCQTWEDTREFLESEQLATPPYIIIGPENKPVLPKSWKALMKVVGQGHLKTVFKISKGDYVSEDLAGRLGVDGKPLSALDSLVQSTKPETEATSPLVNAEGPAQSPSPPAPASELPASGSKPSDESGRGRSTPPLEPQIQQARAYVEYSRSAPRPPRPIVRNVRPRPRALIEWHDPNEKETSDEEECSSISDIIKVRTIPIPRSDQNRPPPPRRRSTTSTRYREEILIERCGGECYPDWWSPVHRPDPPKLTFFWACQIDIELGSWATPWKNGLFWDCTEALDMMVEICMTGIALCNRRALSEQQADQPELYVRADTSEAGLESAGISFASLPGDPTLGELWGHLRDGKHTWPPYALNGHDGALEPTPHRLIKFPTFPEDQTLPPLLLLRSVHHDLNGLTTHSPSHTRAVDRHLHLARDRLLELAALDHWLSHAGTTPAVLSSRVNLLASTPGIIEEIWSRFHLSIMDVKREDKWSREGGGFEEMQWLATSINGWLDHELVTQAECFYVWVALLRAVKVLICVSQGPATSYVSELFDDDVLVYLV